MKQRLGWALLLALYPSYSHSEPYLYGFSGNAAQNSLSWGMSSILPDVPGLDINGLTYRYTTVKETEADMQVSVGNLNPAGDGYTFREIDDWSNMPSNTIVKSFPLPNIPIENWGSGAISVVGEGTVKDAVVIYNFRIDECFDPQLNPSCPGYIKPVPDLPEVKIYAALEDDAVLDAIDNEQDYEYDEDGNIISEDDEKEKETRLELGLTASANALTLFKTQGQSNIINQMNQQTNIAMYYNSAINGGMYNDVASLDGGNISDNKKGLRNNLAQQILHEQMVDMQYNK